MKLVYAEPRENLRLYAGILLLVMLLSYAFWMRPIVSRLSAAKSEYASLRTEIVTGKVKARELLGYAQRVRGLKRDVIRLEQTLRSGHQMLLFFHDVEAEAAHASVDLASLSPGEAAMENDVTRQPVMLTVTGSLKALLHFVQHIEQLPYPARVSALTLQTGGEAGQLSAQVEVNLFSLGAPAKTAPDAAQTGAQPGTQPAAKTLQAVKNAASTLRGKAGGNQ